MKKGKAAKSDLVRIYTQKVNNERVKPIRRALAAKYNEDFNQEKTYNYAIEAGLSQLEKELNINK